LTALSLQGVIVERAKSPFTARKLEG